MDHTDHRPLMTEAVLCVECYCSPVTLAQLAEKRGAVEGVNEP